MNPTIKTSYQRHVIAALFKKKCTTRGIQKIAGQQNAPEMIAVLRRKGWNIFCRLAEMFDLYGKVCWIGVYRLDGGQWHNVANLLGTAATYLSNKQLKICQSSYSGF
jgi:hypothetical protein